MPKLIDIHYHLSRSISDSQRVKYKPRLSRFQSFNKFPEIFDLPQIHIVHGSPMSLGEIFLCISTHYKLSIEILEPNMIYNHYQKNF